MQVRLGSLDLMISQPRERATRLERYYQVMHKNMARTTPTYALSNDQTDLTTVSVICNGQTRMQGREDQTALG